MIASLSPLISVSALWEQLQPEPLQPDPSIVIVDCRFSLGNPAQGRSQYEQGHLPGAVYLDLNQDLSSAPHPDRGRHPLPDPQVFAQTLAAIGVNFQETLVVAYDDSRFAFAARLWWLLRYLGHDRVAVLDGGLSAWQNQGYPLSTQVPHPRPGHFVPQIRPELQIDRSTLKALLQNPSGLTLIDSREAPRYRGEFEPIDPIAGHIPGAINACWQVVTTEQGYAQPLSFHQEHWQTSETIVVYCGSGVTACVNLLSLALAGFPDAKLYPGSWSEWCHCETGGGHGQSVIER